MDHPQDRPARRRARAALATAGGVALGLSGIGAAALPAQATVHDATSTPAATQASHTVTLITGDTVTVTDLSDGTHTVDVDTVNPGDGYKTLQVGDDLHVIPDDAASYLAKGVLDDDLFNVSLLIEDGYDNAHVDATPIIVETTGRAARSAPAPGLAVQRTLSSIGAEAATASHAKAAQTWDALTSVAASKSRSAAAPFADGITAIHLDGKVKASLDTSVPYIGAPDAWDAGYTGEGVTVAVLDTGYDATHPDLKGQVLSGSKSFVPDEAVDSDPEGHGTHVTSTIVGTGAASDGKYRGVADGAKAIVGKVLGNDGYGQDSWIIAGMEWAAEQAPIVSMSLGSTTASDGTDLMSEALDEISESTGALFVVAAGNATNPETIGAPGAAADALTVGSVDDPSGALSWFSSQGPLTLSGAMKPDIAGPGNNITAARSAQSAGEGYYVSMSGTSMATPHIAGAAAILKQEHPDYTADQLRALLTSSSRDVGLSPYQAGVGVVDLTTAIDAGVVASGSADFGMLHWGDEPATLKRTVTYTNTGGEDVTVALKLSMSDTTPSSDGGVTPLSTRAAAADPADVVTLSDDSLTIPAGASRDVTLSANQADVEAGHQLSGALVASVGDTAVARTAVGIIAEAERYNLHLTATDFDGEPTETTAWLWDAANQSYQTIDVAGETTVRLPAGSYSVMSYMTLDRSADSTVQALVGDPSVGLTDKGASVALDARTAKKVSVDIGEKGLQTTVNRMDFVVDGFTGSAQLPVTMDGFYAQSMTADGDQDFSASVRWRLQHPTLTLKAGHRNLDLIVAAGSTALDGRLHATAVDAGDGSADAFAAVDVKGKVAVVTRSAAVSSSDRAANALAAGAKLLIVVDDADGEFSEWAGSADFTANTKMPVAQISGVQGRALLAEMARHRVQISGTGIPNSPEIWDISRFQDGAIAANQTYRPGRLARVETTYAGDQKQTVGEYRYDFVPGVQYGTGFPLAVPRGMTRTEWVSTHDVEWLQEPEIVDTEWQVRDVKHTYKPGQRTATSYFDGIVRPYVGPGYWAPYTSGDGVTVNIPSWADGVTADRTGSANTYALVRHESQKLDVTVDGTDLGSTDQQALYAYGLPDGTHSLKIVNDATQDGSLTGDASTATHTEWTATATTDASNYDQHILPLLQGYYTVDQNSHGRHGSKSASLTVEVGHIAGATGSAKVTGATTQVRIDGGKWQTVKLKLRSRDTSGPGEADGMFSTGRAYVASYTADLPTAHAGWVDLKVTAKDAAGNTFEQEITHAFQISASGGHGHSTH
ncbi:S8 family serine peptidase [Microbacterium horticulturae]|uniref:S8 family serine peptidase n=1 Tax=Microbacterium horticulturae TaxID=3028316 RepID=A0ABY8C2E7_9MICO|nr:S8 family serine peptidase [Microbacterium sp. KACC 23027]WEG09902.1 S8 family serine peptidase [Microbacterium sp. KACC 23027]